jgi:hypothetical protein
VASLLCGGEQWLRKLARQRGQGVQGLEASYACTRDQAAASRLGHAHIPLSFGASSVWAASRASPMAR